MVDSGDLNLENTERLLNDVFDREVYSLKEISEYCDLSERDLLRKFMNMDNDTRIGNEHAQYKIKSRCRHVLSEGRRVRQGKDRLLSGNFATFGRLINESHASCDRDYEISCPELNELVAICRHAGAIGARLTGAGFGGCVVSIIEKGKVNEFLHEIENKYYQDYLQRKRPELVRPLDSPARSAIHGVEPTQGAGRII